MTAIETALPARSKTPKPLNHLLNNIGLGFIGAAALRITPALLAAQIAILAEDNQWGLLHLMSSPTDDLANSWLTVAFFVVFFDFAIYWQHRYFHKNKLLWRLHRVHHSDTALRASSALRFHPVEIFISMLFKSALVITLGIPFIAVVIFEVLLNACAIFNHANIRLPKPIETCTRAVIVTPSMHRVHHSKVISDSCRNFGFCLSIWDRAFQSFRETSITEEPEYPLGVSELHDRETKSLLALIKQPFKP